MRAFLLVSLMSACAAQRMALLFANRTIASLVRTQGIFPLGSPRREFFPDRRGDDHQYWTSEELMNCQQKSGCGGDPCCHDSMVMCKQSSTRSPTARDVLLGASQADRYVLVVHDTASDWASWRCTATEDALQSVTVTSPHIDPFNGWQSLTLHAFVYYDTERGGIYFETRQNNVLRSSKARLLDA